MPFNREQRFTYDDVEAALCLWEDFSDAVSDEFLHKKNDERSTIRKAMAGFSENYGAYTVRQACIEHAPWAQAIWLLLSEDVRDCIQFDWEFIPMVNDLVDWSDTQETPDHPDAETAANCIAQHPWLVALLAKMKPNEVTP